MSKLYLVFVFYLLSFISFGHNSAVLETNDKQTENLASLAKVWGFLKYYHPNVAKGNYNWDEQLLLILPKVEKAQNKEELSKIYLEWLSNLGVVKECSSCKKTSKNESFDKNFNLDWMNDFNVFTPELSQKLKYIEENRFQGKNFYVKAAPHENIEVTNEPVYKDFEFLTRDFRLLSLFRYWNIIEYYFPYKYQTDQNWNDVLNEMIPKYINAQNATEYHFAMLETVIKLDDGHANFYSNQIGDFFGRKYIPAFFSLVENKIVITGFSNETISKMYGLKKGDIVEEIDHKNVLQKADERMKYIHGSNKYAKSKDYDYIVFNDKADSLSLTIKRNDSIFYKKVKLLDGYRYMNVQPVVKDKNYFIDENNIGYIDLANLGMKEQDDMMRELQDTKALIIDIRNYPKIRPYRIARRLIQNDKEYLKIFKPDFNYPGKFVWKKTEVNTPLKNEFYAGKVVLIVNEETQSAAEYLTMLLQTGDNVTTLGSQTAGADGDICKVSFLGFKAFMSGLGIFYPDDTPTQRVGVKVDIEVRPTIKGIQEERDELMEAAKEYVLKEDKIKS